MRRTCVLALALVLGCGGSAVPDAKCETSISGVVYAPNGTLPLWNVAVYVPATPPGPFIDGISCTRCSLPGDPIVRVASDESGAFRLTGVPPGDAIALVITTGKWRRQITVPHVEACRDTPLPAEETHLPQNRAQGDLPRIAISTGLGDALECLVRKLGIADLEISTPAQYGRVHMYSDRQSNGQGANKFADGFPGASGFFDDSQALWTDPTRLAMYDVVILSCEGGQYPNTKRQAAMNAIVDYADHGGRLYLSHWHNVWIEGATQARDQGQKPLRWPQLATFIDDAPDLGMGVSVTIDETSEHGVSFASWLTNVGASAVRDVVPLEDGTGKKTCTGADPARVDTWVEFMGAPQTFQFTTPIDRPEDQRCGKVVFTDMHVSGDSKSTPQLPFPEQCAATDLTAQEKALAFMFFDLGSCLGDLL